MNEDFFSILFIYENNKPGQTLVVSILNGKIILFSLLHISQIKPLAEHKEHDNTCSRKFATIGSNIL